MAVAWFRRGSVYDQRDNNDLAVKVHLPHHESTGEHVALLVNPGKFDLLGRKDDLLGEGVAAVFGVVGGEAELVGLCFHAGKFTAIEARRWLSERGFPPLLSSQAGIAACGFDHPLAAECGSRCPCQAAGPPSPDR